MSGNRRKTESFYSILNSTIYKYIYVAVIFGVFAACESPSGSSNIVNSPTLLSELQINPSEITLDPAVQPELRDFDFLVRVNMQGMEGFSQPKVRVVNLSNNEVLFSRNMTLNSGSTYAAEIQLTASTTELNEYHFFVYSESPTGNISNTLSQKVRIIGALSQPPFLEYLNHPETVTIPTTGTTPIRFETSAIHPNGQSNIQQVLLDLFDSQGVQLGGSSFQMQLDDTPGNANIYSITFQINPGNQPEVYDIRAYAIDRLNVSSDTLFSTMSFVSP